MKTLFAITLVLAVSTVSFGQTAKQDSTEKSAKQETEGPQTQTKTGPNSEAGKTVAAKALDFKMKSIDGADVALSDYAGKVVVFVNTASKCGLTPQYEHLQALHDKYADKGLAIIGIPCNQFGGQEPGTEAAIKTFCQKKYGVTFDMLGKVDVNGKEQCDLYRYLVSLDAKPKGKGDVSWNFEKFVLDRNGNVIARFGPRTKPDSDEFVKVIEGALGQ